MPDRQTAAGRLGPRSSGSPILLTALFCVLAVLGGMAAALGSVLMVGMLAAALVGAALLMNPRVHLFFGMVFALVITGVMEFFFFFGQANWLSSLIVGSMLIPAVLRAVWDDSGRQPGLTIFSVLILAFLGSLLFSSLINGIPIPQAIVGLRNYLPYIGIAALVICSKFDLVDIRRAVYILLVIGLIQTPVSLYQFFVTGPWRASLRNAVGRADEAIVGTFGGSVITGGYTGEMAAFLAMLIVFVIALYRIKKLSFLTAACVCLILLVPILLAETKIALVLLPVLILVCFAREAQKSPVSFLLLVLGGSLLFGAVAVTYYFKYWSSGGVATQQLFYSFDPDFMVSPTHRGRVGTIVHWFLMNVSAGDLLHSIFGYGVASSLENSATIGAGSAVLRFGLGLDSHAMSRLLWDGGVITFFVFFVIGLRSFLVAWKLSAVDSVDPTDRAGLTFATAASLAMVLMLPYQTSVLGGSAMQFIFWFVVGYVEYMRRSIGRRDVGLRRNTVGG